MGGIDVFPMISLKKHQSPDNFAGLSFLPKKMLSHATIVNRKVTCTIPCREGLLERGLACGKPAIVEIVFGNKLLYGNNYDDPMDYQPVVACCDSTEHLRRLQEAIQELGSDIQSVTLFRREPL
jgi:hypothetical protein